MSAPAFLAFGPAHLAALVFITALAVAMIAVARSGRWPRLVRAQEWVLVVLLLMSWPADWLAGRSIGHVTWEEILPLHLCDLASFAGAAALIWHHRLAAELTYFWAMTGTFNGLITPTVQFDFPHPAYFAFFLLHGTVVATAAYLVAGRHFWPRPGAVRRAVVASLAYLVVISAVNFLLGTNFAFVREKPESASLLDALGEWPWYVLALIPIGTIYFFILYLPFWFLRRLERMPGSGRPRPA